MQRVVHEFAEIIGHFQCLIIRRYICISCHANVVRIGYFVLVKYQMQVFHDYLFHADITDVVSRKHQDVGYIRRHRNDAEHLFFFVVRLAVLYASIYLYSADAEMDDCCQQSAVTVPEGSAL